MAIKKPLAIYDGNVNELQPGDTLDAPTSAGENYTMSNANAAAIIKGHAVYISGNNAVNLARANASATADVFALVDQASIAAAATGSVKHDGVIKASTAEWDAVTGAVGGLTAGAEYFLSATVAGQITATAPSASGQFVACIGRALSTTELSLSIERSIGLA
jgi:Tfp pilus assembly protein FimV